MNTMDCKTCQTLLPDLLLDPESVDSTKAQMHVSACSACAGELQELRATFALMDEWVAPEPSPYFDTQMYARLREAQAAAPESLWERLTDFLRFGTGRQLRPALAGLMLFVLLLGGGTAATVLLHHGPVAPAVSSPTVNDLKIFDNNAQALQEMDILDDASDASDAPQS